TREDFQSISFEGTIQNIGNGGACIETSSPLSISEVLKIAFPIQSSISSFISTPRTLAEVKWTHPVPGDRFISGLRFLL
ncbi:MAG TPA: hypothetical protein VFG95_06080, partial [Nitrospiria bacterium]|nr:hypothetical protein [Nitrospiria bacterium]